MKTRIYVLCVAAVLTGWTTVLAQSAALAAKTADRSAAYYNYAMGHLYAELAGAYGNRGDYLNKAIEHYRAAIKADPSAAFLTEELSDLYIQSGRLREAVAEAEEALKQNPDDLNSRRMLARIYARLIGDSQQNRVNEEMVRRAIEQYQKIAEKTPKDVETWVMLGRLNKVLQNSVESEKSYNKALEVDPGNEDALTVLAMVYADLGDNKKASEVLQRVVEKNPSLRTLTALAGAYEQMHQYGQAAETLRRTLELSPDNDDLKRALAQNLLLADKVDEALKIYQELVAKDPKDVQSHLRLSQIYRQKRDYAKAREAAQKARELDPNSLEIRYNDVSILEAEGKLPEAITAMKQILDSSAKKTYNQAEKGNRVVLLERLGQLQRQADQTQQAVETYRQIAEVDPDLAARAAAQVIDTYRLARDYGKAVQEADAAQKKFPNDRLVNVVRASVLADAGRIDEAVAETKKLFDGKNDRENWISLAQVYEKGKRYAEMAKAIDEAAKLSNTAEEKENIHFMRGAMYEKLKQFDRAEAEFRKVLETNPKSAAALNYLGYMLADRNVRLAEAQQMITQALEADPENGAYLDSLGWVYYRQEKYAQAEEHLRRALAKTPHDPTIRDHLGDVYSKQGKLKEAIAEWQASLKEWEASSKSDQDPAEIAKIQKKLEGARVRLAAIESAPKQK